MAHTLILSALKVESRTFWSDDWGIKKHQREEKLVIAFVRSEVSSVTSMDSKKEKINQETEISFVLLKLSPLAFEVGQRK